MRKEVSSDFHLRGMFKRLSEKVNSVCKPKFHTED